MEKKRGSGAPEGATTSLPPAQTSVRSLRHFICEAGRAQRAQVYAVRANKRSGASPSGAPLAAILGDGAVLPGADSGLRPPDPAGFRPRSSVPRPAIEGSPSSVGTDGCPRPPGVAITSRNSRRRPLPAYQQRPAERPREGKVTRNIVRYKNLSSS